MPIYTSRQAKISLSVPGVTLDNLSWDKFSGGDHTADTQVWNPGGMGQAIATGGVSKRATITIERAWDDTLIASYIALDNAVNSACSVGVQTLKNATTNAGRQRTYTGVIKEVHAPEQDSTSSTISKLQVVIEPNESITG